MSATRTGLLSGKAASSASAASPTGAVAVATMPMIAVATGARAREPVARRLVLMPWLTGMGGLLSGCGDGGAAPAEDRKSVVSGKGVSVGVDVGGRRCTKKKKT